MSSTAENIEEGVKAITEMALSVSSDMNMNELCSIPSQYTDSYAPFKYHLSTGLSQVQLLGQALGFFTATVKEKI